MNGEQVEGSAAGPASGPVGGDASGSAAEGSSRSAVDSVGKGPGELNVTLSPSQIIGGFAVVAGLIVWLIRRARRGG